MVRYAGCASLRVSKHKTCWKIVKNYREQYYFFRCREGFNYGFKTKDNRNDDEHVPEHVETVDTGIPEDAYLMVSQLHWEDDVVWDGQEIKSKVLQKLNSKTNLAGWLPSSGSRTAGAFSQPGKGSSASSSAASTSKLPNTPGSSKLSKGQALLQKLEEADDTWYSIFPVENEELIYSRWGG